MAGPRPLEGGSEVSERNGDCRLCRGTGQVPVQVQEDLNSGTRVVLTEDCPRCDGTGFSGAAYPEL